MDVGCSPMARPISRLACATRVSESMISSTLRPCARKYSAIAVARSAPRIRNRGDLSAGTATMIVRAFEVPVSAFSTKWPTSRPRSPTSPTTTTSASVKRVIMPRSTDLPTPEPAMIPRRWPQPMLSSELITRTPTSSGSVTGERCSGLSGMPARGQRPFCCASGRPSSGWPRPSITRPSKPSPTLTMAPSSTALTVAPTFT